MPGGNPDKLHDALRKMYTGEVDFDEMTGPTGIGRAISVPLQKLDLCAVCQKTTELRLCSSCASVGYLKSIFITFAPDSTIPGDILFKGMSKVRLEDPQVVML